MSRYLKPPPGHDHTGRKNTSSQAPSGWLGGSQKIRGLQWHAGYRALSASGGRKESLGFPSSLLERRSELEPTQVWGRLPVASVAFGSLVISEMGRAAFALPGET